MRRHPRDFYQPHRGGQSEENHQDTTGTTVRDTVDRWEYVLHKRPGPRQQCLRKPNGTLRVFINTLRTTALIRGEEQENHRQGGSS